MTCDSHLALSLLTALALAGPAAAQEAKVRVRPFVGVVTNGAVAGLELAIPAAGQWELGISGRTQDFATDCASVTPNTCGDDGRGAYLVLARIIPLGSSSAFQIGPELGLYRFADFGRSGHSRPAVGARLALRWRAERGLELGLVGRVQRVLEYRKDGRLFRAADSGGVEIAVGLPFGR